MTSDTGGGPPPPGSSEPETDNEREAEMARLRRKIEVGLAQARAGELLDGEEVFAGLERRGSQRGSE